MVCETRNVWYHSTDKVVHFDLTPVICWALCWGGCLDIRYNPSHIINWSTIAWSWGLDSGHISRRVITSVLASCADIFLQRRNGGVPFECIRNALYDCSLCFLNFGLNNFDQLYLQPVGFCCSSVVDVRLNKGRNKVSDVGMVTNIGSIRLRWPRVGGWGGGLSLFLIFGLFLFLILICSNTSQISPSESSRKHCFFLNVSFFNSTDKFVDCLILNFILPYQVLSGVCSILNHGNHLNLQTQGRAKSSIGPRNRKCKHES